MGEIVSPNGQSVLFFDKRVIPKGQTLALWRVFLGLYIQKGLTFEVLLTTIS
jgi:hypothetical protein